MLKRAVVVIKICDGIGGMHGSAGGRIIGIIGIMGTIRIMRGLRHEIARGFACFCKKNGARVLYRCKIPLKAGARGGSGV